MFLQTSRENISEGNVDTVTGNEMYHPVFLVPLVLQRGTN